MRFQPMGIKRAIFLGGAFKRAPHNRQARILLSECGCRQGKTQGACMIPRPQPEAFMKPAFKKMQALETALALREAGRW